MQKKKIHFVILLFSLLSLGFLITCFISYYVAHDSLSSQIAETALPLTSDNVYSEIQRDLLRPIFISSLMAHDTFLRDWALAGEQDEEAIVRYLGEIQKKYSAVTSFFISETTRKYYHPRGVLKVVHEDDPLDKWYFRVQKMHDEYEINVDIDTADNRSLTIFINYKVFDYSGNYIGATGVGLAVEAVKEMIKTYQSRYGRRIYFINRQGDVTLQSADRLSSEKNIRQMPALSMYATQILTTPGNSLRYKANGKTIYFNSRYVPEFGWYLIVEQEELLAESRILMTLLINLGISIVVTAIVIFIVNFTIGKYQNKLEKMATTDRLTGLANRHVFDMLFEQAAKYSRRKKGSLSAIMFDLDRFKQINDTYGHSAGDVVLKTVSKIAKDGVRDSDMLFRWGGEEFFILLTDCNQEQAVNAAEKIRMAIEQHPIALEHHEINVTASFGVAQVMEKEIAASLLKRVDAALYSAKEKGRNRVEVAM